MRPARSLAEQAVDRTGSRRRADHTLRRLDLLSDDELDHFRARFRSEALDASELLAERVALRLGHIEREARKALEGRIPSRPILTIAVCLACGAHEVVRMVRPWAIDRAMMRTGLAERDVRAVIAVLAELHGDHEPERLDALTPEQLRDLLALVGQDFDAETLRAQHAARGRRAAPGHGRSRP